MSFTDYSISLSFTQKKEWAKVHGRFEDISFLEGLDHNLDVLSGLLDKYTDSNKNFVYCCRHFKLFIFSNTFEK